jgi:uncharacterized protein YdeI (YjbR/CyaY-like superfamily)
MAAKKYQLNKFNSGMCYILVDQKTVTTISKENKPRAICLLNNAVEFHCAFMPKKEGDYYVHIGAAIRKKLQLKEGSRVTASFKTDETPYQFNMPEELKEVLDTDARANKIFHNLTEGNQRGLIYLVQQPKSSEKKIERSLKIAAQLKAGISSPQLIL